MDNKEYETPDNVFIFIILLSISVSIIVFYVLYLDSRNTPHPLPLFHFPDNATERTSFTYSSTCSSIHYRHNPNVEVGISWCG